MLVSPASILNLSRCPPAKRIVLVRIVAVGAEVWAPVPWLSHSRPRVRWSGGACPFLSVVLRAIVILVHTRTRSIIDTRDVVNESSILPHFLLLLLALRVHLGRSLLDLHFPYLTSSVCRSFLISDFNFLSILSFFLSLIVHISGHNSIQVCRCVFVHRWSELADLLSKLLVQLLLVLDWSRDFLRLTILHNLFSLCFFRLLDELSF